MTRTKSAYLALLAVLLTPMAANADLIMVVTDDGSGNSRFVFSGSAEIVSGSSDTSNSIWLEPLSLMDGGSGSGAILSGSGTVTTSSQGTFNVFDVFASTFGFAPRVYEQLSFLTGTSLSWSGDIVADLAFSSFTQGSYSTSVLGGVGGRSSYTIDGQYVLIVGSVPVPEPGTLALFGIGLLGMAASRRRKKA